MTSLTARKASLLEYANDGLVLLDRDGEAVEVSPSYAQLLGYTPDHRCALRSENLIHPDDRARWLATWTHLVTQPISTRATITLRVRHNEGRWCWMEATLVNRLADPAVAAVVATVRPLADIQLDGATSGTAGWPNAPIGLCAAAAHVANMTAHRDSGNMFVLLIKIDQLHMIARTFGCRPAKELAEAVVRRLARGLHDGEEMVRVDYDLLAVISPTKLAGRAGAEAAARRVTTVFAEPFSVQDYDVVLTASIGIAQGQPAATNNDGLLLNDADLALAAAIARGGRRWSFFDPAERADALIELTLPGELLRALAKDQFVLHYQPVVDMQTGAVVGEEALMRWAHPTHGLLAPDQFIPAAERSGVIAALGSWAIRQACQAAASWPPTSQTKPYVSVNLSARQLENPNLAAEIRKQLAKTDMEPSRLILEVTEGTLIAEQASAVRHLNALRELGVRIAVDDFGTGYSSLAYLKRLPLDTLKIDRCFVNGVGNDKTDTGIVTAIITLAQALNLDVVAEGVETETQAAELRRLGCPHAQGYLYGRATAPHLTSRKSASTLTRSS